MPDKKVLVDGNYLRMNCVTTFRVIHHIIENIAINNKIRYYKNTNFFFKATYNSKEEF
jgi:outer membrane receptor for monomeric catechols